MSDEPVDLEFRRVLGHFPSGIVIVTGIESRQPFGLTCQSFFALSLNPRLVAIAISESSTSWKAIERSGSFCANVLPERRHDLCRSFARTGVDKFRGVEWQPSGTGSPRLRDALAWIDCTIDQVLTIGDHKLVVGAVCELGADEGSPLLFFRGQFGAFGERSANATRHELAMYWDACG
jgi:3-hydroxy-9,10-secoandrosta-1,3,5(10)-triene-9,17-dione monooxygenase reductase component